VTRVRWRLLSPSGAGPVAVLGLEGPLPDLPFADGRGERAGWPAPGRFRRLRLLDGAEALDEVLVLRTAPARAELHVHGGSALLVRLSAWLLVHGVAREERAPEAPASRREARALLSCRCGRLASLLAQARRTPAPDARLLGRLRASLALAGFAERLARPASVRLSGPPNAGKSSLFNALLGSERALVSPVAGTTRDTVTAVWSLRGVPVELHDSAGQHGELDGADADVVVAVLPRPGATFAVGRAPNVVSVLGRSDLWPGARGALRVSARTGEGLADLRDALAHALGIPPDEAADEDVPVDPGVRTELVRLLGKAGAAEPASGGLRHPA
jgi:tRNA modification GTPase